MKETADRFWAMAIDRRNAVGAKLRHTLTDLTSDGSDISSPPRTPRADEETTLEEFFNSDDNLPSPPRSSMKMRDVDETLKTIYPNFAQLRDSEIPEENEKYCKLAYAVGKGFFDHLMIAPKAGAVEAEIRMHRRLVEIAKCAATLIIDRSTGPGQRFHALCSAHDANDRQWTPTVNNNKKMGTQEYEYYIQHQRLPEVANFRKHRNADIYEVFSDEENFPNLKPQYRVQSSGSCFAQAAILQHFYLQLVHDKQLMKEDAYIADLSRFMRNHYDGKALYEYIVDEKGDTFLAVLNKLLDGDYDVTEDFGDMSFDGYVSKLKEHGPAIVKMFVGNDFKRAHQYKYEGEPPRYPDNEKEGHAMLLVGVMRVGEDADLDVGTDLCFILQNFWHDKQFVRVQRDYFRECSVSSEGGKASINFVAYASEFKCAGHEAIYAKKAEHDVSLSSHLLERPTAAKSMVKLRIVDSKGNRHTTWL